jgi:GTP cyclohydrolase I
VRYRLRFALRAHIAPEFGKAHIYPRGGVDDLSKHGCIVDALARRLQTQEGLSAQIVGAIEHSLETRGIAVMIEAEHTSMAMRGVRRQGASTVTTQFSGVFRDAPNEQTRLFNLLRGAC